MKFWLSACAALSALCVGLVAVLAYWWWRAGSIVMSNEEYHIRVREIPYVREGAVLDSPPGVAQSAFIIEVGKPLVTTYLILPESTRHGPTSIVKIGSNEDTVYQVEFSNGYRINVRLIHGAVTLAEWFRGNP